MNRLLAFIGSYTYVFYLIHIELIRVLYLNYGLLYIPEINFDILINLAGIVIAFVMAVVYQSLIK